jgi:hypothetical protein
MQQGMLYLFRKDFLANYEELGEQVVLVPEYDHLGLSVPQVKIDREALYGTLKLACAGGGLGSLYLIKYESTLDGFRVWHAFIKEYDDQGCTDVADMKWMPSSKPITLLSIQVVYLVLPKTTRMHLHI